MRLKITKIISAKKGKGGKGGKGGRGEGGEEEPCGWRPLLILVPVTLGATPSINPCYVPQILRILSMPQSAGIVGGRPGSSLFLIGRQNDRVLFLDPHRLQPSAAPPPPPPPPPSPSPSPPSSSHASGGEGGAGGHQGGRGREDGEGREGREGGGDWLGSYFCDGVRHMAADRLDPSLAMAFYCRTPEAFEGLWRSLGHLQRTHRASPLLTLAERPLEPEKSLANLSFEDKDGDDF